MKKITYIIAGLFLVMGSAKVSAQMEMTKQDCTIEYNLYKGDVQGKNFAEAKKRLDNLMSNCPTLSVNIYKLGADIAENMIETGDKAGGIALFNKVYEQRVEKFPKGLGKVYSDWYSFLNEHGSSDSEIFHLLEKGYEADPSGMSAKNIYKYFDVTLEKNKNSNPQLVLDTYDNINDALETKSGVYQQRLSSLLAKEEAGATLGKRDAKSKRIAEGTLTNIGIISGGLDQKIDAFLSCDRLIPLYRRDFEANKSNAQWLKRSVSKMYHKECTSDPLYEELAEAYANAERTSSSLLFYAGILEKRGKTAEAQKMVLEATDLETDPTKKSKLLLQLAQDLSKKGQRSEARKRANEALQYNSSNGRAYLLIASMYASSANSCGTNEFQKRMVYVAALNKARRAASVDPSISSIAQKYINSYSSNIPTKQMGFAEGIKAGDSFRIGCWIGETVTVQLN
ncbi:tetratricopeptide repeat protein [Urechidicola croceus]|uniref:Uncharacterized protein n=1 Tax=Urechidicola croceus TaxID=1850246 RepID=A0A1D8P792_9FLAO|nr:hypothetical protein [Urechidicola croceus]AOW20416.1 hypothetical protein LPB138_06895 [Urechidicola croceus]